MQREIKSKSLRYGIVALLLACVLTATIYNFGMQTFVPSDPNVPTDPDVPADPNAPSGPAPQESDDPQQPSQPNQPTDPSEPTEPEQPSAPTEPTEPDTPTEHTTPTLPPAIPPFPNPPTEQPVFSELKKFDSFSELETFVNDNTEKAGTVNYFETRTWDVATFGGGEEDYSTTNIQVAGVDEADIVKSDGEYLYVVSEPYVYILKAYPAEQAEVVSKIECNVTYGAQIYVNDDKLVVLTNSYPYPTWGWGVDTFAPDSYGQETAVKVYDIADRSNPVLSRTVKVNGTLLGSRMIGDYVYVVANQIITYPRSNGTDVFMEVVLPTISGNHTMQIEPTEIFYIDVPDVSYQLTTIIAVNVMNDAQEPTYEPFLTGYSTDMYVSLNNMYLVAPNTNWYFFIEEGSDEPKQETLIYRIELNEEQVNVLSEGTVPGTVLNQFSMDEHNGHFRIATTTNVWWSSQNSTNQLYVLDMNLDVVGKLEDLGEGETIYSARFMGDRGYIVTFRKIDPFFVLDLADPTAPTVLGELKITGYSDYLHPYDENHILGIGKETELSEEGDFSWYQGVKMLLFDVSDVSNPREVANYSIGDRGTTSPILDDHKALLFDESRNLLVIPVLVAELDPSEYPGEVPDWAHGDYVWQGACVFDISPDGILYRGGITHVPDGTDLKNGYWSYNEYFVERALYIEGVLYTVSGNIVKMNDLGSLDLLNEIELS
ncbi:MAG: beta-propeller domain-containing protein [Candidatus Bathyarchaeota archaeon]